MLGGAAQEVYPPGGDASKADVYSRGMTWVQDGIFAAGGETLPNQWADFAAQTRVSAILHLRPEAPAAFGEPAPAAFLWIDVDEERRAGLSERMLAGSFLQECLIQGNRVLLHASRGRHRTRWCYVAYRILAGSAPQAALRRAAQPPWMAPYRTDEAAWRAFARQVERDEPPDGRTSALEAESS